MTEFDPATGEVLPPATGLYAAVAAQLDKSLTTARAFPRSLARVGQTMSQLVMADEKTAESFLYSLKRSGRTIQGPSARFAEALAYAYGHLRVDARLVEEGRDFIVVRGEAHDLERNVIFSQDVTRRIVDSKGKRFDVDLISVTYMAAASIAQRDCILKVVPSGLWRPAFEAVLQRITGDVKTLADRRMKAIGQFAVLGVSADQVFRKIGVKGINDVTADHLIELVGTFQAIKAGDSTVEAEFGDTKITGRLSAGSPLAAPEDTGEPEAEPAVAEAETAPEPARALDGAAPDVSGQRDAPRPAAAAASGKASKKTWGPFSSFESALKQYEKDLLAAGSLRSLQRMAVEWGSRPYWVLDEPQSRAADAAYEAAKAVMQKREKEKEATKAREAYESSRDPTDIDGPTEVYREEPEPNYNEAVEFEPVPVEHPHGFQLSDFAEHRPRNAATIPIWETIVNQLLEARTQDDPMAIFRQCEANGLISQLDEDDANDLRTIRFKIKQQLLKR